MIQLLFDEVRMTSLADAPVLVLREAAGSRRLAIFVSTSAAAAVMAAIEDADPAHPSLPDVFVEALATRDAVIDSLHLNAVVDGVYTAQLWISGIAVDCRASDGITLALRSGAPILIEERLLAEQAVAEPEASGPASDALAGDESAAVRQFREVLNHVRPEDYDDPTAAGEGPPEP